MFQNSTKFCPECAKKNVLSRMRLFQITFDTAVHLCSNEDCISDLTTIPLQFVDRKLDAIKKSKRKKSRLSSKSNSIQSSRKLSNSLKEGSIPTAVTFDVANSNNQPYSPDQDQCLNSNNSAASSPSTAHIAQNDDDKLSLSFLNDDDFWDNFDTGCGLPTSSGLDGGQSDDFLREFTATYTDLTNGLTEEQSVSAPNTVLPGEQKIEANGNDKTFTNRSVVSFDANSARCDTYSSLRPDPLGSNLSSLLSGREVKLSYQNTAPTTSKCKRTYSEETNKSEKICRLKITPNLLKDLNYNYQCKVRKVFDADRRGTTSKLQRQGSPANRIIVRKRTVFVNNISPLNSDQSNASDGDVSIVTVGRNKVALNVKKVKVSKPKNVASCETRKTVDMLSTNGQRPQNVSNVKPNLEKQKATRQMLSVLLQGSELFGNPSR